ncbi:MAG: imidazole glycerol phosphate synthase subunit HisH [Candidatus Omnitrophica bacterium]|nr:imidazole glycerol phosphate synthase subunit HisH [Candidatus Omnitrophota bacterium]
MIAIIDYGMGNLRSVSKALDTLGAQVKITNKAKDIKEAAAIILPGVGAFHRAMENLTKLYILPPILRAIKEGKPFLGICLGLQLLFTESEEHGTHTGLNIVKGKVKRFSSGLKVPHMGWNQVNIKKPVPSAQKPNLFKNISDKSYFYFIHSYFVEPEDKSVILASTKYGTNFTSAIRMGNVFGTQFHPEKSGNLGLKALKNFCQCIR